MSQRGFTLIELVVVMAVVATLAGIMVPFIYHIWENNEKELTRNRMSDLRKAMAGDPDLKQDGVRTDFGFVGSCGQLPGPKPHPAFAGQSALSNDLVAPDNMVWQADCINRSPYLSAGFNANTYNYDAWGNEFVYTTSVADSAGRRVSGELRSVGPDRELNSGDDIWIAIEQNEVVPAQKAGGTALLTFSSPPLANLNYSAKIYLETVSPNGSPVTVNCSCAPFTIGGFADNTQVNYTFPFPECNLTDKLIVGKVSAWADLFLDASCTALKAGGQKSLFTVNDRQETLLMNLHISPVPYP